MSVAQDYRNVRGFILRGTRASQPAVVDVLIGALYFVTGENVLERSNGTIWESYSGLSGGNAGGLHGPPGIDGSDGNDIYDIYPNGNVVKERTTPVFTTVTTTGDATFGGQLRATSTVQHSIGGSINTNSFLTLGGSGTFTGSGGATRGVFITSLLNLQGAPNDSIHIYEAGATIVEAASGTHPLIAGIKAGLSISAGAATTTLAASGHFSGFAAPTGTVTAAALYVDSACTGATNNYSLLVIGAAVRFTGYGAGTATFDASGNITSVSDEKLKTNIVEFKIGLKEIMGVNPIKFRYSASSGLDTENDYTGFSAQNVMKFIPEAVGKNLQGDYSLNDRALLAAAVNAIKTLKSEIDELRSALGLPAKDYAPKVRNYYENNMIISRKKAS